MMGALATTLLGATAGFAVSCFGAACAFTGALRRAAGAAAFAACTVLVGCIALAARTGAFCACGRAAVTLVACLALAGTALGLALADAAACAFWGVFLAA